MKKRTLILLFSLCLILGCAGPQHKEAIARFKKVKVGQKVNEVKRILGKPSWTFEKNTAPKNYYIKGYSHKKHAIKKMVLIFDDYDSICYVYFDENDLVEFVFIGGS